MRAARPSKSISVFVGSVFLSSVLSPGFGVSSDLSGCSSSGGSNGDRSPLTSAISYSFTVLSKYGSGCRDPHGEATIVRSDRSERKYNHFPSALQAGSELLYRSVVTE